MVGRVSRGADRRRPGGQNVTATGFNRQQALVNQTKVAYNEFVQIQEIIWLEKVEDKIIRKHRVKEIKRCGKR